MFLNVTIIIVFFCSHHLCFLERHNIVFFKFCIVSSHLIYLCSKYAVYTERCVSFFFSFFFFFFFFFFLVCFFFFFFFFCFFFFFFFCLALCLHRSKCKLSSGFNENLLVVTTHAQRSFFFLLSDFNTYRIVSFSHSQK